MSCIISYPQHQPSNGNPQFTFWMLFPHLFLTLKKRERETEEKKMKKKNNHHHHHPGKMKTQGECWKIDFPVLPFGCGYFWLSLFMWVLKFVLVYCLEAELEHINSCCCGKSFSSFRLLFDALHLACSSHFMPFLTTKSQTINSLHLTGIQLSDCQDSLMSWSSLCMRIVQCSPKSGFFLLFNSILHLCFTVIWFRCCLKENSSLFPLQYLSTSISDRFKTETSGHIIGSCRGKDGIIALGYCGCFSHLKCVFRAAGMRWISNDRFYSFFCWCYDGWNRLTSLCLT